MMKHANRLIALALAVVMLLGLAVTAGAATGHSDWASVSYQEAAEVLTYLGAFEKTGAFRPKAAITAAEADKLLKTLGAADTGLTGDTVTGGQLLDQLVALLAIEGMDTYKAYVRDNALLRGIKKLDQAAPVTREQAAQMALNALDQKLGGTGAYLAAGLGLEHKWDVNFKEAFNRPGSYWVKLGTEEKITEVRVATPVMISGEYITWCRVLEGIGYPMDGTPDNEMKWFRNTENGNEYTVRFEKCHWGDGGHGGCGNDYVNSNGQTLEVYQIGDHEYLNVMTDNFLAKVDGEGIRLYGYSQQVWGPWPNVLELGKGYYIVNYYWNGRGYTNADGTSEGYVIVEKAKTTYGQLDGMEAPYKIWINDVMNIASDVYSLGFEDVFGSRSMDNYYAGKYFTFFLDPWGLPIGNLEPSDNPLPFTDVVEKDWFFDSVVWAYTNGVMNGTSGTSFSPNTATTRAMLVTMLWRLAGKPAAETTGTFSDVAPGTTYAKAIDWAAENKIVTGSGDLFRPDGPITREQLASILYRYAKSLGDDVSSQAELDKFVDADKVSGYAEKAMKWAVAEGLITGTGKNLNPQGTANRAQVATILERYFNAEEAAE